MKNAFRFLCIAALAGCTLMIVPSCSDDYDDSEIKERLDKVENRVTALEKWCSIINSEIASLKRLITALENKDYVTGVETLENGYKITFSKSGSITIQNGKDGGDGEDGKDGLDGYTPIIGVAKHTDGLYYWTTQAKDGKTNWLTDVDGNMIRTTGNDGVDGSSGNNAPTPIMKTGIELGNDYIPDAVYLSVDSGESWKKVSGDRGEQGVQGPKGDSLFKNVDNSNDDYVIFTLQDGTPIEISKWFASSQEPVPTGIIILDYTTMPIVKGGQAQIKLRVNPSGFKVTKENIELDVWNSDTYFLDDKNNMSRASYVTPSDYYELVKIEPDKNTTNEELEGQWIATIQSKGVGNYRNLSELSLVVNYTDSKGDVQRISCPQSILVETVPTVEEGIAFSYSKVQTIYTTETNINPYMLFTNFKFYKNTEGEIWHYNMKFIAEVKTELDESLLTADTESLYDKHYISFTPNMEASIWKELTEGKTKKASSSAKIKLIDFAGCCKELDLPIVYCPSNINLNLKLSAKEVNKYYQKTSESYFINIGNELAEYGLVQDVISELTMRVIQGFTEDDSWMEYHFPMVIEEMGICTGKIFNPILGFHVYKEAIPGTRNYEPYDETLPTITIGITSIAQELVTPFSLVALNIKLYMEIIE